MGYDKINAVKKNFIAFLLLALITLLALFGRLAGFGSPHEYTWDEEFYVQMADNLCKNPLDYNCLYFRDVFKRLGLNAPAYLNEPIFKHPPFFSYLISVVYIFFKANYGYAFMVSLFFGLALITMTYFLAASIFGGKTAIMAAFLAAIDPVGWTCSEKIWMETALVFFMWLSLYFVIKALSGGRRALFYIAGIFSGLAMLTKYPAFLVFPIGINLALVMDKKALGSRHFWAWPVISLIIFAPWVLWNYNIYGAGIISKTMKLHEVKSVILTAPFLIVAAIMIVKPLLKTVKSRLIFIGILLFLVFSHRYVLDGIVNMFNNAYVPPTGWKPGMFQFKPRLFYFRRLIELSPFYLISFIGFLFLAKPGSKERIFIIPALWGLIFYSLWGSYQSRYILFAVPPLLILACRALELCWAKIDEKIEIDLLIKVSKIVFVGAILFCLLKTVIVDINIPMSNDFLYF